MNMTAHAPQHFAWVVRDGTALVTLTGSERKNPLTFESYAELRDTFRALATADDVDAVVVSGEAGNFCSGGDVHDIIGPLTRMDMPGLLNFTRMTGDLVKAIRRCPQPVVAAVDGVCAGAGAAIATACDLRLGTARATVARRNIEVPVWAELDGTPVVIDVGLIERQQQPATCPVGHVRVVL